MKKTNYFGYNKSEHCTHKTNDINYLGECTLQIINGEDHGKFCGEEQKKYW